MKIIYNKYFPRAPFLAINLCGLILCRGEKGSLTEVEQNHERIHTQQQREMLYVGFLLWYAAEFIIRFMVKRNFMLAYYSLYFEREAYTNERNMDYCKQRRHFAWWHQYVRKGQI